MQKFSWFAVVAAIGSVSAIGCSSPGRSIDQASPSPATLGPPGANIKVLGVT